LNINCKKNETVVEKVPLTVEMLKVLERMPCGIVRTENDWEIWELSGDELDVFVSRGETLEEALRKACEKCIPSLRLDGWWKD